MIGPVFGFQAGQLLSQVADQVVMIGHGGGHGSGLLWGPGLVVTNQHVAERGNPVVIDRQGVETRGRVLAVDKENDLAAISVRWTRPGPGSIADSDRLQIG